MNTPGLLATLQAFVRPGVLVPHLQVASLRQMNWRQVYASGVRYIVFDKDNCLTRPHEDTLVPVLEESWEECKKVFGDDRILIVSNSAGSNKDPTGLAAEQVSSNLGVPILCHSVKKPGRACAQQVTDYMTSLHLRSPDAGRAPRLLVVGDRITTDMAFSYRLDTLLRRAYPHEQDLCMGVLTRELWAREKLGTRVMRAVENTVLRQLVRGGIPPGGTWSARRPASDAFDAWVRAVAPISLPAPRPSGMLGSWMSAWTATGRAIVREMFESVRRVREVSWSVLTNAPTRTWRSTWRKPQRPPRVPWSRSLSTSACTRRAAAHEKPVLRRVSPPSAAVQAQAPHGRATRTWLGIPLVRWVLALITLILLPLGFMGGMKLSEWVERWRLGDLSDEGVLPVDAVPPPAPEETEAYETRAQLQKKIASLELEHFHLRRERAVLDDKLARLAARPVNP
ncbi:phosphatidylglycerophosphatase [Malassezia nana]|uniref:Phosphatidylglycerophosphatase n=1 Tax=Malassezia nana TaxID=180528 RepID=A0AAF0J0X5_9BASI|nr:phosphatidylglycerophosphatase [Malassezia nana]